MNLKTIKCQTHSGTFSIPARRGRPPTKCTDQTPCNKAPDTELLEARVKPGHYDRTAQSESKPRSSVNPSLAHAQQAKALLEPEGWVCAGKAWTSDAGPTASLTASRGEEMISLTWVEGKLIGQDYSLWDVDRPNGNGRPQREFRWDPDELTDQELVRALSGEKVTWWNRLANSTEAAVVPDTLKIEHSYDGTGSELPGDRIVKFIDLSGSGFRAFRVDALIRVGSPRKSHTLTTGQRVP